MTFDRAEHRSMSFCDQIIQRDALEMLNVSPTHHRLLHGLPCTGINPKIYAVPDVERRAREIVSLPEIAANMMTHPATAYQWLKRMNVRGVIPGGWDRKTIAQLA
jgi:hypothetical protein